VASAIRFWGDSRGAAPGTDAAGKSTDRRDTLAVTNHRDAPRIDQMIEIMLDIEHMFD
jgi:hypothetical protein